MINGAISILIAALFTLASSGASEALQTKKDKALARCDISRLNCDNRCDTLIDIDNAIRDCQNRCQVKHSRCTLRANQLAPTQSQPGDSNSDVPVLSTE